MTAANALSTSDSAGGAARPAGGAARSVESEVEKALAAVNPDELTPKQALELLYELRRLKR